MGRGFDEVRTERLVLRRPTAGDATFLMTLLADPRTTTYNPSDAVANPGEVHALLQRWEEQWSRGLGYWIVEELSGAPVGVCGVKAVELADRDVWNLLYRFLPRAWGLGYAREAAAEAVRAGAAVDPSRAVIARVRRENSASARVAAAIGLVRRPELDLVGEDGLDEVWSSVPPPVD